MRALLLPLVCIASGCGITFGVDAVERTNLVEAEAAGATTLHVGRLGVKDDVSVCGSGDKFVAVIHTTEWTSGDADPGELPVDAGFTVDGEAAAFTMAGGDETIVLRDVHLKAPSTISPDVTVSDGNLTICDFTAPVTASVAEGKLTLTDIEGAIVADAGSVDVDFAVPIDLTSNGAIIGSLSAGGSVLTSGSAAINVIGEEFDSLDLQGDGAEHLSVWLPRGGAFTLQIQSNFGVGRVLVAGIDYDSSLEDAEPVVGGLEFEINGGGPIVSLTTTNANVLVWESAD